MSLPTPTVDSKPSQGADLVIIGGGQAATPLALRFAAARKRVVLIERSALGGTCINTGCTPTKTMIASARAAHVARTCARLGVHAGSVAVSLAEVVARKDALVERWRKGIAERMAAAGVQVVRGHGRFVGDRQIEVDGERYRAPIVVLDVGARASVPPLAGVEGVPWLDNESVMRLRELPEHLIVLGGGYIGCEMSQMFRRFGAAVTIVHGGEHLLSREDADVAAAIQGVLRNEGITLRLGHAGKSVSRDGSRIVVRLADGSDVSGTHLLLALGRRPNTDDLGCEAAGVKVDARGAIVADDFYRTGAPGVYAVGDVLGGPQFTHTAWDDHRRLFDQLMSPDRPPLRRSDRIVPYTVFTDPQVACAGLNETRARARDVPYELATMPFADIARAIEVDETAGMMKILVDPRSEKILGVSLVGAEAGELLHIFVPLIQAGTTARPIVDAEFVHPTFAEGVQSLVMKLARYALS
jgi:pyruvate/2-oxoglutarate dehydrogenase complex dihydrolipoamide dehydrogenase (E3) component